MYAVTISITDAEQVLQSWTVFSNVSKGLAAKSQDLRAAWPGVASDKEIVLDILERGELQVGDRERAEQSEHLMRDIVQIVVDKSVDAGTKRPFTATSIEKALAELHFSVNAQRSAKQQALEAIKALQEKKLLPIVRAQMRVRVTAKASTAKKCKEMFAVLESEDWDADECSMVGLVDPGVLRHLADVSKGAVTTLSLKHVCDEEITL